MSPRHSAPLSTVLLALCLAPSAAQAQLPPGDGPVTTTVTVLEPSPVKFQDDLLARLAVPAGFRISVFARDLQNVRWLLRVRQSARTG